MSLHLLRPAVPCWSEASPWVLGQTPSLFSSPGPEDRRPPGASWATSNSDKKRPRAGTLKSFPLSGFSRVKKWISLSNQKSACFRRTWSIRLILNGFLCWDAFLSTCVVESHSNFTTEIKDSHSGSKSHFVVVFFNSKNMLVD